MWFCYTKKEECDQILFFSLGELLKVKRQEH
jgi:hypothetical protein